MHVYKGCTTWHLVLKACLFSSIWPETSETSDVQAVLIDCSSVIFVDVAGARLFTQVSVLNQDHHAVNFTVQSKVHSISRKTLCATRRLDSDGCVFFSVLQMCTECQKVGIHVYLSNCNGRATLEVFSAIPLLNMTLLRRSCIRQTLISAFCLLRERPEDPHVERSNELHEPSAYFRHRSRRRDVYSAAEGKPEEWERWPTVWARSFSAVYTNDPPVIRCRRNLQRAPPPFGCEAAMSHALVILDACRGPGCQRRNYIVF